MGTQKANNEVVKKAGGESDEGYITRISTTTYPKTETSSSAKASQGLDPQELWRMELCEGVNI